MFQILKQLILLLAGALFWGMLVVHLRELGRQVSVQRGLSIPWAGVLLLSLAVVIILGISSDRLLETQVSDSVEYILSSQSIAAHATYSLAFPDTTLPPRFPPWFSLLIGAPFLALSPDRLELLTIPQILFVVASVSAAFLTGMKLQGYLAGLLAALFLAGVPGYRAFSQSFLIDLPTTALFQVLALSFMCAGAKPIRGASLLRIGMLSAVACGFRMTSVVMLSPFIWHQLKTEERKNLRAWFLLLSPLLALVGCNAWYNSATFGSLLRTGYHAWIPIPYEFMSRTFALVNVPENLREIAVNSGLGSVLFALLVLVIILKKSGRESPPANGGKELLIYLALAGIPLLLAFTFYFYKTLRFYLPVVALLSTYAAILLTRAMQIELSARRLNILIITLTVCVTPLCFLHRMPDKQRQIADLKKLCTPQTTLIASGNPLWLYSQLIDSCRMVLPFSRHTEFASKAYLPFPLGPVTPPADEVDTRTYALLAGGHDIYREVAEERWPDDRDLLLDTSLLTPAEVARIDEVYIREPTSSPQVVRLRKR